jgi:hypothetical protein
MKLEKKVTIRNGFSIFTYLKIQYENNFSLFILERLKSSIVKDQFISYKVAEILSETA